jgi:AcrR family transcriptional regulator
MGAIPTGDPSVDDRTTRAKIRDAAIICFAENGIAGTTARKVATAAGVSPGLVIHHFGTMDGLRSACDEHVALTIRNFKYEAIGQGPNLDVLAALRGATQMPLIGYLAAVLGDDSPIVNRLVDDLVSDAEGYVQHGVDIGTIRPSPNPRGRAAVLTLWSLGALVMHRHINRILGVDLTDPEVGTDPAMAAYALPVYEIMGQGIFTEPLASHLQSAFTDAFTHDKSPESAPTSKEDA